MATLWWGKLWCVGVGLVLTPPCLLAWRVNSLLPNFDVLYSHLWFSFHPKKSGRTVCTSPLHLECSLSLCSLPSERLGASLKLEIEHLWSLVNWMPGSSQLSLSGLSFYCYWAGKPKSCLKSGVPSLKGFVVPEAQIWSRLNTAIEYLGSSLMELTWAFSPRPDKLFNLVKSGYCFPWKLCWCDSDDVD